MGSTREVQLLQAGKLVAQAPLGRCLACEHVVCQQERLQPGQPVDRAPRCRQRPVPSAGQLVVLCCRLWISMSRSVSEHWQAGQAALIQELGEAND